MKKNSKIVIFGGNGLLGSAVKRVLIKQDFENINFPRSLANGVREILSNKKELERILG